MSSARRLPRFVIVLALLLLLDLCFASTTSTRTRRKRAAEEFLDFPRCFARNGARTG
jgi:hypothetical protein